jgi:hypothetical protein
MCNTLVLTASPPIVSAAGAGPGAAQIDCGAANNELNGEHWAASKD